MIQSCCASRKTYVQEHVLLSRYDVFDELKILDLSNLNIHTLPAIVLQQSDKIEHLILDENELEENFLEGVSFPNLKTLSLNSNNIKNVGVLLHQITWKCPNLIFLSLIGNPGWPHPVLGNNVNLYKGIACTVCRLLPNLKFLDSLPTVTWQIQ